MLGLLWALDTDLDLDTFWKTLPMSAKGGKAYTKLWAHDIWKASLPWLKGSIFQDMYWGNWCDTLKANRSISGVSLTWHRFIKIVGFSFHLLLPLVCLDSLSASTFIDPGKYSAVIVIFCFKRYCQIYLLIAVNAWFLVPPFSLSMKGLLWCPCGCVLILHPFPLMWRTLYLIWLSWAPKHLCETFVPPWTMAPLLSDRDKLLPSLVMMYVSELIIICGGGEK